MSIANHWDNPRPNRFVASVQKASHHHCDVEQPLVLGSDYKAPCHRNSDSGAEKNKIFVLAVARAREIEIVASAI